MFKSLLETFEKDKTYKVNETSEFNNAGDLLTFVDCGKADMPTQADVEMFIFRFDCNGDSRQFGCSVQGGRRNPERYQDAINTLWVILSEVEPVAAV